MSKTKAKVAAAEKSAAITEGQRQYEANHHNRTPWHDISQAARDRFNEYYTKKKAS